MADIFSDTAPSVSAPPTSLASVTPSDGADLARATRAINVAVAGVVQLTTIDGTTGNVYISAGIPFPIRAVRIFATGTTATGIRALW